MSDVLVIPVNRGVCGHSCIGVGVWYSGGPFEASRTNRWYIETDRDVGRVMSSPSRLTVLPPMAAAMAMTMTMFRFATKSLDNLCVHPHDGRRETTGYVIDNRIRAVGQSGFSIPSMMKKWGNLVSFPSLLCIEVSWARRSSSRISHYKCVARITCVVALLVLF
jgi:hypothetical protein